MGQKWFKSSFPNIQYKKHPTRKHGVKFDQYFRGSYQVAGKRKAINFGWASEGWTESLVWEKLNFYKNNAKTGSGPTSLSEERESHQAEKQEKEQIRLEKEKASLTLNGFFHDHYFPQVKREKKERTFQREESLYNKWIDPRLGDKSFNDISKADIEGIFYDITESGKSIRTAEYALTTLKQIWREAKGSGHAPEMPAISKALKKQVNQNNNSRVRFLSHEEADRLLDELKTRSIPLYEKTLISLQCGLRASEIFKLTWSQVDLEHGIFNIINSKGRDRSVYMTKQVKELFYSKTPGKSNELVFPGREGKISNQISKVFQKVADDLFNKNIDDSRQRVVFHTCRHTAASWMVMQGISLYVVQKVLGHTSITVTERYSHLAPDQLQLAASAIDKAVFQHKDKKIVPFKKQA